MAQPAFGKKKSKGTKETLELVVCVDVSNSMNVKDIADDASRLDITKRALNQLVNQLHGERLGICIFANSAFVQLPLTQDYGAAKLFLEEIETNMISDQGTNINAALETAGKMFSEDRTAKGIIIITDGENHEENPAAVFQELKEKKITTIILGIGTQKGGLVPKDPLRPELGFKKTAMGTPVHSKLNTRFLNNVAKKAGTELQIASSEFPDLRPLLTQINQMKRVKIDNLEFEIKEEQYQIPLAIAFSLWILYLLTQFVVRFK
jgi:Ca-activated chloride channel family protein